MHDSSGGGNYKSNYLDKNGEAVTLMVGYLDRGSTCTAIASPISTLDLLVCLKKLRDPSSCPVCDPILFEISRPTLLRAKVDPFLLWKVINIY